MLMHISVKEQEKSEKDNNESKSRKPLQDLKPAKISRKKFFQRIGLASLIPFAGIWYTTSKRAELRAKQTKKIIIPANIPAGISFYDSIIVSKEKNSVKVFSAKCSHLGCLINKAENGNLVCPCHGSRYSYNGSVEKGPAAKPLEKLPFKIDPRTGELSVNVQV